MGVFDKLIRRAPAVAEYAVNSPWYNRTTNLIGEVNTNNLMKYLSSQLGLAWVDWSKHSNDYFRYNDIKDVISRMPLTSLLGGSAALSTQGTVNRPTIGFHDLDFNYRVPYLGSLYELDFGNLPLKVPTLREFIPKHLIFRKLFPVQGTTPTANPTRRFAFTEKGIPVDVFLADKPLVEGPATGETQLTPYSVILDAKRTWVNRDPGSYRSVNKDKPDIDNFKLYSELNPVINESTGESLFSPMLFLGNVTNPQNQLNVSTVPLFPGSRVLVPVIMNWKGLYKQVGDPIFKKKGGRLVAKGLKGLVSTLTRKASNYLKARELSQMLNTEIARGPRPNFFEQDLLYRTTTPKEVEALKSGLFRIHPTISNHLVYGWRVGAPFYQPGSYVESKMLSLRNGVPITDPVYLTSPVSDDLLVRIGSGGKYGPQIPVTLVHSASNNYLPTGAVWHPDESSIAFMLGDDIPEKIRAWLKVGLDWRFEDIIKPKTITIKE